MGSAPSAQSASKVQNEYTDVQSELEELTGTRVDDTPNSSPKRRWGASHDELTAVSKYIQSIAENSVTSTKLPEACDATADSLVGSVAAALPGIELGESLLALEVVGYYVQYCTLAEPFLHLLEDDAIMGLFCRAVESDAAVLARIQDLFFRLYSMHECLRSALRNAAHQPLRDHANEKDSMEFSTVASSLRLLLPLYKGLSEPLQEHHLTLTLHGILLPLARTNVMGGVDTPSPMDICIDPLIECMTTLLNKVDPQEEAEATVSVFKALFKYYDPTKPQQCANLLAVVVPLADALDGDSFSSIHQPLLRLIAASCGSDHSSLALAALQLWQRESVITLARRKESAVIQFMSTALARHGNVHWDANVVIALLQSWSVLEGLSDTSASELRKAMLAQLGDSEPRLAEYREALEKKRNDAQSKLAELKAARAERDTHVNKLSTARKVTRRMDFIFGKVLGKGAFSTVRYARVIEPDVPPQLWSEFAVKEISKVLMVEQDSESAVAREIAIHSALEEHAHTKGDAIPGIATLFHRFDDGASTYLVLDFYSGGDLFDIAIATNAVADQRTQSWLRHVLLEVATALNTVHEAGWFYGDVKPENVLLSQSGHVSLADFGAAMPIKVATCSEQFSGTVDYAAPELLEQILNRGPLSNDGIDPVAADWWSFGCLAVQLLTGNLPFMPAPPTDGEGESHSNPVELFHHVHSLAVSRQYVEDCHSSKKIPTFVKELLNADPTKRPRFLHLKKDPFFEGIEAFTSQRPAPPPKLEAATNVATKHSGRKESMMWRQVFVNKTALVNAQHGVNVSKLDLCEESSDVDQLWPRGLSHRAAGFLQTDDYEDPMDQFITKMPR